MCKKIQTVIAPITDEETIINLTDPDAPKMKGKKGNIDTYYNVQIGCNEYQTILYANVNQDANDKQQLQPGIEGVEANTGQEVNAAIADPGYASCNNYEYLEEEGIIGYIPDQDFGKTFADKPYHHEHFKKHAEKDELICPTGQPLIFFRNKKDDNNISTVYKGTQCHKCPVKENCTKASYRTVSREKRAPLRQKMRERLQSEKGKEIYKKRLHPVEAIFGHLKFNLGYTHFLLRGLDKVNAEFYLMCIGYNLMKLATIFPFFQHTSLNKANQLAKKFFIQFFQRTFKILLPKSIISITHYTF